MIGIERVLTNRQRFIQPPVDIGGPLIAVALEVPCFLVKQGAPTDKRERSNDGCQSEKAAAKMN